MTTPLVGMYIQTVAWKRGQCAATFVYFISVKPINCTPTILQGEEPMFRR